MKFDPDKEYGNYIIVSNLDEQEQYIDIVRKNSEFTIPEKFHKYIKCPIIKKSEATSIKVTEDNLEMLGVTKEEIGKILDIPEHWSIGWIYESKKYRRTG